MSNFLDLVYRINPFATWLIGGESVERLRDCPAGKPFASDMNGRTFLSLDQGLRWTLVSFLAVTRSMNLLV